MSVTTRAAGLEDVGGGAPLPPPRGPLSEYVLERLIDVPTRPAPRAPGPVDEEIGDPLVDEDLALALYVLYELHYRSFSGVSDEWEWDPGLLTLRSEMEACFERAIIDDLLDSDIWAASGLEEHPDRLAHPDAEDIPGLLRAMIDADDDPSLSRRIETQASKEQMLEFLIHRSAYQLKEADPHSWAIPRLSGPAKAALVEIQSDEYGGGDADFVHAHLFARALEAAGLNAEYGFYLERIPGPTLAAVNLMSFFGLHRAWRGAIAGHLAVFEMTSTQPNRRYGNALRRLGFPAAALEFFDEHVEADAVHENIAAHDLAANLARDEGLGRSILIGAGALIRADQRFARSVRECWDRGESTLLPHEQALSAP